MKHLFKRSIALLCMLAMLLTMAPLSVFAAEEVGEEFHPRYDVKYKEYVYKIWNSPVRDPFTQGRAWHCPKKIDNEGLSRMKSAAAQYVGKKDFCSFMAADSKVEDTVREVFEAEVERFVANDKAIHAAVIHHQPLKIMASLPLQGAV